MIGEHVKEHAILGVANKQLNNLSSVAINTSLTSDANDTDDLGTDALIWRDAYLGGLRHGLGAGSSCGLDLLMTGSGYTSQINVTGTDYTNVLFQGGPGTSGSKTGRNITIKGGLAYTISGANTGGSVYLTGANGSTSGVGGSIIMTPGTAASGTTGVIQAKGQLGIIETGVSPTYYTYLQGGAHSPAADITYTLPVASATGHLKNTAGTWSWDTTVLTTGGGTLTGNITLGENTSIALDPAGSVDGKYSGITMTGVAGATVVFGDLITLDKDDSRWELVDISSADGVTGDARGILGMAVTAGNDGDAITILLHGNIRADDNFPNITIGAPVYATTAGNIVVAQPSTADYVIRVVGFGLTINEIYFNPSNDYITHT
jgi:hypothetical protein